MQTPDASRPHAVFQWGDARFAIDVAGVQEVVSELSLTPLPRADPGWLGVGNLRGEIIPALSLAHWFAGGTAGVPPVFLVIRTPAGRLALAVDAVVGVRAVPLAVVAPGAPAHPDGDPEFIVQRCQTSADEPPLRRLDTTRLAQKLREQFVLSSQPPA